MISKLDSQAALEVMCLFCQSYYHQFIYKYLCIYKHICLQVLVGETQKELHASKVNRTKQYVSLMFLKLAEIVAGTSHLQVIKAICRVSKNESLPEEPRGFYSKLAQCSTCKVLLFLGNTDFPRTYKGTA